jgi:hypothetical protein
VWGEVKWNLATLHMQPSAAIIEPNFAVVTIALEQSKDVFRKENISSLG